MPTEPLHESLEILADLYGIRALVISDDDGLLIGANTECENPEPLAAVAVLMESGEVPAQFEAHTPTVTETYKMQDYDILISAVGEVDACKAAIQAARPHLISLVA